MTKIIQGTAFHKPTQKIAYVLSLSRHEGIRCKFLLLMPTGDEIEVPASDVRLMEFWGEE